VIKEPPHIATTTPDNRDVLRKVEMALGGAAARTSDRFPTERRKFGIGATLRVTQTWAYRWADPECD